MKIQIMLFFLIAYGCKKEEESHYVDQAQLTCYAGEKVFYQITTEPYKIHNPTKGNDRWEIDSDQGKIIITGTCIYKPLNF